MKLKNEFLIIFILSIVISFMVILMLFKSISSIALNQEIHKASQITKIIYYYRMYLTKVVAKHNNFSDLTCSPAYATNQVLKMFNKDEKITIRQVSDRYRNIADKPNKDELKAINFFKKNKAKEYCKVDKRNNVIEYAYPLYIQKNCMKCHGIPYKDVPAKLYHFLVKKYGNRAFNYKIGDLRGIVYIKMPYTEVKQKVNNLIYTIVSLVILLLIGLFIVLYYLYYKIEHDINVFSEYFNDDEKAKKYKLIKNKLHYLEFEFLKKSINKTLKKLRNLQSILVQRLNLNPLTHLLSRNKFFEDTASHKYPLAIFNIDKFKEINNFYGVEIGDLLIKKVAKRFVKLSKKYNFRIYHLNIDEFGLAFREKIFSKEGFKIIIRKILQELEKSYKIDETVINIKFRVGISYMFKDATEAIIASDYAKDVNKDIVFCSDIETVGGKYKENIEMFNKLKWALENDKIVPYFQGLVDRDKKIVKYEALVRMIDENGKVISPFFFLDIAKQMRLYKDITKIMIQKSFEKFNNKKEGVSINLTLEDLESTSIKAFIQEKLKEYNVNVTFEVVENENVKDMNKIKEFLNEVKEKAKIYIDDFGSGYANFDYLLKLGADGVKIDGSLVKNILTDEDSEIIIKLVIEFAKQKNIDVVAEYVGNEEIFEKLKSLGVDYFQGHYFCKPEPFPKELNEI